MESGPSSFGTMSRSKHYRGQGAVSDQDQSENAVLVTLHSISFVMNRVKVAGL